MSGKKNAGDVVADVGCGLAVAVVVVAVAVAVAIKLVRWGLS